MQLTKQNQKPVRFQGSMLEAHPLPGSALRSMTQGFMVQGFMAQGFMTAALPTAADVDAAAQRLAAVALRTPLITSPALEAVTGARVWPKAETLQRTGSFKFRGACNSLAQIAPERRAGGVVAYSSGNHAQGVAAAAALLGMPALIVMPSDAPRAKRERTAALGAEVVLYDRVREDREAIAREIAARRNATLVPPYDHPQ